MAYDRYDTRDMPRDERSRRRDEQGYQGRSTRSDYQTRNPGSRDSRDDRGFFERAGDEIASWFGDEDGRGRDREHNTGAGRSDNWNRDRSAFSAGMTGEDRFQEQGRDPSRGRDESRNDNRGVFARGGSSDRDYDRDWRHEYVGRNFRGGRADREPDRGWTDRYQPVTGDYGRSGRGSSERSDDDVRSQSKWAEDEYRGTSRAGSANWSDRSREDRSDRSREDRFDPHYRSWRDRHLNELDRDYDDYRAENQSRFESDFGSWRERRQQKRAVLGQVREHMEVLGSDKKPVGTVDKAAGDRLILTKSDPESGGIHHSLSCSDIDRVEGDRVILDCTAEEARQRWRDESRGRALFEGDDEGEMGPRVLDRSFRGTYR